MRVLRNGYLDAWEKSGSEVQRFPFQALAAMQDGVFHLGGDERTEGVDPERECYPAGQGVGGIDTLIPAAEVVHQIVGDAESVLARLAPARV